MKTTSVMIVGVGGQGSLLASRLLGTLLTDEGYDVRVSEVHGMSQENATTLSVLRNWKRPGTRDACARAGRSSSTPRKSIPCR